MKLRILFYQALVLLTVFQFDCRAAAQAVWQYHLIEGSSLLDDCLICDRVSVAIPMRGTFNLRKVAQGPFNTQYALENIDFQANGYSVRGSGTLSIGGDFAITQTITLDATIKTATDTFSASFTNQSKSVKRRFPMLSATMQQTNGAPAHTFTLQINAAPIREIWFSTAADFHAANIPGPDNQVTSGDILSMTGRVVKRNSDLTGKFPGPTFENVGLDAFDLLPGAEIAFSTGTGGLFNDGDVAQARSTNIFRYADFLAPLATIPDGDPGLDALSFETPDKFYFSLKTDILSKDQTEILQHGDILWTDLTAQQGGVFRKNSDLLSRFDIANRDVDYGVDAIYIWPSGEIWFSTRDGFTDSQLGDIAHGDLISDQGYIVFRNNELLAAFAPLEKPDSFGFDAVSVITDVTDIPKEFTISIRLDLQNGMVALDWQAAGRVFQIERADDVAGPFSAVSEIISDLHWEEPLATSAASRFYLVRQW